MVSLPTPTPTQPPFLHLPSTAGEYRKNWFALQTWTQTVSPYACCYNPTGVPGTMAAGNPGADTFVSWTPVANQDAWEFLTGNSDATWIRFPYDGLYNLQYRLNFTDAITQDIEMQSWVDYANTSSTGFGAVSFTNGRGTTTYRDYWNHAAAAGSTVKTFNATFLNFPAAANDVARVGFRVISLQAVASSTIVSASFSLAMPIPFRLQSSH